MLLLLLLTMPLLTIPSEPKKWYGEDNTYSLFHFTYNQQLYNKALGCQRENSNLLLPLLFSMLSANQIQAAAAGAAGYERHTVSLLTWSLFHFVIVYIDGRATEGGCSQERYCYSNAGFGLWCSRVPFPSFFFFNDAHEFSSPQMWTTWSCNFSTGLRIC